MLGTANCVQSRLCTFVFCPTPDYESDVHMVTLLSETPGWKQGGADVLGWGLALHRRMQLHEEPPNWSLRRPCWLVATCWIKLQKCLKEMPSPSPTPIFDRMSPSPWSEPNLTRFGIWEPKRFLNSSTFSVPLLSPEAEWNWVTIVLIASLASITSQSYNKVWIQT